MHVRVNVLPSRGPIPHDHRVVQEIARELAAGITPLCCTRSAR